VATQLAASQEGLSWMMLVNCESVIIGLILDFHSITFWIKNNRIFFENKNFATLTF
jgi:hypothetical protein